MWEFIEVFKRVFASNRVQDDDFADRLSHRHTVALLILFTIVQGSGQMVGNPIGCWCPAQFTGAMVQYTNYICWISNTYYVPTDDTLPNPGEPREGRIAYYQWVPFILALMAFLFYIPFVFWRFMAKTSGLDAKTVMKIVRGMDASSPESRSKSLKGAVRFVDRAIEYHRDYYGRSCLGRLRRQINRCCLPHASSGAYIMILYMICKIAYIVNVIGQFFLLNSFMGDNFNIFGFQVIRDIINGKDFWESKRFPRVSMCDFTIRTLGENNQKHTIQCTLPINLFNEKIFAFIWFWMFVVAACSVYSFFIWFCNFTPSSRRSFVKRYLHLNKRFINGKIIDKDGDDDINTKTTSTTIDEKIFDSFVDEYLKQDGVFLLRIVKKNSNDIVVGELVCALWDHFKRYPKFQSMPLNNIMNGHHHPHHPHPNIKNNNHHHHNNIHDDDDDLMHKEKQAQMQQQQNGNSVIIPNGGNSYHNL